MQQQRNLIVLAAVVPAALILKGCDIPKHNVGNWRSKESYLVVHEVVPPGADAETGAVLNSCLSKDIAPSMQCSGHGKCAEWVPTFLTATGAASATETSLSFCKCDVGWADPECRTARKSQLTAFVLSITFGIVGADQFYLGYIWAGLMKLCTLGGFGIWYIFDLIRLGSAPALTQDRFKVANDLHHTAFLLITIGLMLVLGFVFSIMSISRQRQQKAREIMILRTEGAKSPLLDGSSVDADGLYAAQYGGQYGGPDGSFDDFNTQGAGLYRGGAGAPSAFGAPNMADMDGQEENFRGYRNSLGAAPLVQGRPSGSMVYGSA